MDYFTLNLRPEEYFQLAPNMRTAYIELCIYAMSKSVTYRPELSEKNRLAWGCAHRISQTSREILYKFGRRSAGEILYAMHLVAVVGLRGKVYIIRAKGI